MVRIAGSLLNGLLQSFQSIHALTGEDSSELIGDPITNDEWGTFELFENIIEKVKEKNADIKGLLFRAGIEFIKGWYHYGGGKSLVNTPVDFLLIQTDNQGYSMVVQGDEPGEAGWVHMEELDREAGTAIVQSTVPFPIDFTRGVFVGGMNLLGNLDYLNVEIKEETSQVEGFYASRMWITFIDKKEVSSKKVESLLKDSAEDNKTALLKTYYWKYEGLCKQIENEKIYRDQLNSILIKTTEDLQYKNKALHSTLQELEATQDQLIQQEKMASLGQLTAGVAHEINNPINFVANNAEVLEMDMADLDGLLSQLNALNQAQDEQKISAIMSTVKSIDLPALQSEITQLLSSIKSGAKRISTIVKSLQYLSYTDQENKDWTNIQQPIDATLVILNNKLEGRISIKKQFADCPEIKINTAQINQVLLNILNNAIQSITGQGEITIRTECKNDQLQIQIEDTGCGMNRATQLKIFEPFFTTKKIGEGTGLGLSISYGIIQAHNGKIEVESEVGRGAKFNISLPY